MASQFQNRLVGISILVASVVIFLPSVIDGKKTAYEDEFMSTPLHPELKTHNQELANADTQEVETSSGQLTGGKLAGNSITDNNISESRLSSVKEDDWNVEEVAPAVTVKNTTAEVETSKPAVKAEPKKVEKIVKQTTPTKTLKKVPDTAWTIQLGAFQNAANINSLLKKLHKAGFQAHTVPTDVIDGELTRLFVGPDVSKSKLEKQLPRLKRLTKLEGKVRPFDAVNP